MNAVNITGRLTQDPELISANSTPLCRLRLAVRGMARGAETGFIDVSTFGKPAEAAARTLSKGWLVGVSGRLDYRQWIAQDGTNRTATGIIGNVEFLSAPRGAPPPEEEDWSSSLP